MSATIGILLMFGAGYFYGQKGKTKPIKQEYTDDELEQQRQMKRISKDFKEVFGYSVEKALQRKDESR